MLLMLAAVAAVPTPECQGVPIRNMIARYAALQKSQDVDGIARLFGSNGVVDNPGAKPVRGAAAIRAFLGGFHGFDVTSNELTVGNVAKADDGWHVTGRFHQTGSTPDAKSYDVTGSFDSSWTCAAGGWQVRRMATGK